VHKQDNTCCEAFSVKKWLVAFLAVVIIVVLVFASLQLFPPTNSPSQQAKKSGFHVGVSFCGNTSAEAKLLIDKVKSYTNLLVVQSGPVSANETALNEIVNYAVAADLDVVVAFGFFNPSYPWQIPWLDYAKQQWGSRFLGIYMHDEPGGTTIDANYTSEFLQLSIRNSEVYAQHEPAIDLTMNGSIPFDSKQATQAAYHFVTLGLQADPDLNQLENRSINAFASDYALYWFDYLGGYDTIFAEFGSNQSTTQAIDMVRGAANLQNKTWGTIITWTYNQPPYIVNGTEMYNELVAAYTSGAKYEIIFDYPQIDDNPYGVLTNEHFAALEKFWSNLPTLRVNNQAEAALVLPANYGWAMRSPQDRIWGLWAPDNTSTQVWNISQKLQLRYGTSLDIIIADAQFPVDGRYAYIYYWNQTS
jgi:hypothetical protein